MSFVSVATFNVHYICKGHGCRVAEKVALAIADCGADIVCLQESNEEWQGFLASGKIGAFLSSKYRYSRFHNHSNQWGGFAVFSKYPIQDWQVIKETHRWWYPAGLVTVEIPKKCEKDHQLLQLLIVHLRAPVEFSEKGYWWGGHVNWVGGFFSREVKAERLHEIQTFAGALHTNLPTIILGDFNERGSSSPCLSYVEKEWEMKNLPKKATTGCLGSLHTKNSWRLELGGIPIISFDYDHIVYSYRYLESIDTVALVHGEGGSDHRLVSAKFRLLEEMK